MYHKIFFFLILSISIDASSPRWFETQNLSHTPTQLVGYGQAKTIEEAKQNAKKEIAEMLQLDIDSTLSIRKSNSKNIYDKNITQAIVTKSSVRLNGLDILKQEKVNNIWFVAILHENLPLFKKIINITSPKREVSHSYLNKTKLFKRLKNYFGFYPSATLYNQNGQYYISFDNHQFLISEQEFMGLFINSDSYNIEINFKEIVKENEAYFITTKFKKRGFASLFLVAQKGTVVTLFKNIEVVDEIFTYPNRKEFDGLKAKIEDGSKQNKDMFVALLCDKKEDIGLFNQLSTELEENSFRFGDLVDLMDKCTFSTRILTILRE